MTDPSRAVLAVVERQPGWDRWIVSARVAGDWTLVGVFVDWSDARAALARARTCLAGEPASEPCLTAGA